MFVCVPIIYRTPSKIGRWIVAAEIKGIRGHSYLKRRGTCPTASLRFFAMTCPHNEGSSRLQRQVILESIFQRIRTAWISQLLPRSSSFHNFFTDQGSLSPCDSSYISCHTSGIRHLSLLFVHCANVVKHQRHVPDNPRGIYDNYYAHELRWPNKAWLHKSRLCRPSVFHISKDPQLNGTTRHQYSSSLVAFPPETPLLSDCWGVSSRCVHLRNCLLLSPAPWLPKPKLSGRLMFFLAWRDLNDVNKLDFCLVGCFDWLKYCPEFRAHHCANREVPDAVHVSDMYLVSFFRTTLLSWDSGGSVILQQPCFRIVPPQSYLTDASGNVVLLYAR
jgi:hypothetical protein